MTNNHSLARLIPWIARTSIGALFLVSGMRKVLNWTATAALFSKLGIPMADAVTALVAMLEIGGSILLIAGVRIRVVASVLAAFTVVAAVIGHPFWIAEPAQFSGQLTHFLKNLAIVGGLLLLVNGQGVSGMGSVPRTVNG